MTNDFKNQFEQAIKRIKESGTVAIVLPDAPGLEIIGSASALASGLRALGKAVSVFGPPALASKAIAPWPAFGNSEDALREFIISFDLARSPIKELKYERDENRLNIILSPTGSRLRREDVEFRYGGLRYELVIAVGVSKIDEAGASIKSVPELFYEKPILNLDTNPANSRFGEMNLVPDNAGPAERPAMPELVAEMLSALNVPPDDPERSNALFVALAAATNEFRPERMSAKAFILAGELLSRGADHAALRRVLSYPENLDQDRLAARAVVRSRLEKESDLVLSLLTKDDFVKTNCGADETPKILGKIMNTLPYSERHALLWQSPEDGEVRYLIAERDAGKTESSEQSFPSFAAAEEHIRQLFKGRDEVE